MCAFHVPAEAANIFSARGGTDVSETVEVKLPPGPASFCSPRVNGRVPGHSFHIKRTYAVTIEPNGCTKLIRQAKQTPRDHDDSEFNGSDTFETKAGDCSEAMTSAQSKRQDYFAKVNFRQRRAEVFEGKKGFPVLVTRKLVPEWRECNEHFSEDESQNQIKYSQRRRTRARLIAPTLLGAIRQQSIRPPSPEKQWFPPIGVRQVQKMCSRRPALCHDAYAPPGDIKFREETPDTKSQWVGERTIVPASLTEAKATISRTGFGKDLEVLQKIDEIRCKGRANNEALQSRYEKKAEAFKDAQEKRGPLSNFALRELRAKGNTKEVLALPKTVQGFREKTPEAIDRHFSERMSIGFSRYRGMNRLELPQ